MGMYIYISEEETKRMKWVQDNEIHDLLQEALVYSNTLLIEESYFYKQKKGYRGWLLGEKEKDFRFQVYHESRGHDGAPYQAKYQTCGTTKKEVMNYLFGIINGGLGVLRQQQNERV